MSAREIARQLNGDDRDDDVVGLITLTRKLYAAKFTLSVREPSSCLLDLIF